ncbi:MAG: 50S ribosomal protein L24 [Egibacteraceae bacterium]
MARIRRNDTVRVISGKDAGKSGRVVRVYPKIQRVMVEGVNRVTKHTRIRATRRGAQEGGIEHVEAPLHISNVMPICTKCDQPTRVGQRITDSGKVRYCRRCDAEF